jgi:hypothetical protein
MADDDRNKDYSQDEDMQEEFDDLYQKVMKAFENKEDQSSKIRRYWDIYNCKLGDQQAYTGTSKIFIPIVRDTIEARVTRFSNMIHPQTGRSVEVLTETGDIPYATVGLLEHYVRKAKLRSMVTPALIRQGDVEGQYSLFVEWKKTRRFTVDRTKKPLSVTIGEDESTDEPDDGIDVEVPGTEIDTMTDEQEVTEGAPAVVIVPAQNLAMWPSTSETVDECDGLAIAMRLSKDAIRRRMKDGDFDKDVTEEFLEGFEDGHDNKGRIEDPAKKASEDAGVKTEGTRKVALIYMVWSNMEIDGETRRMVTYFAGPNTILSCKRNPYWSDRIPLISVPRLKIAGSIWGMSGVEPVEKLQYQANDAVNMGMDSAQYSLMPITMTDPEQNPRTGSMVLAMGAIWQCNPNSTKFIEMAQLHQPALQIVAACKEQIMQSLSVSPAMITQSQSGKKPSQNEIANEQQVAVAATADVVTVLEESIYTPLLEWFYELDYQFRDEAVTIEMFGQVGMDAKLEKVPPIQVGQRYSFRWYGSESLRTAQQVQQQVQFMNVLRGIPPQQLGGLTLDISPIIQQAAENVFGPRLAPKILKDERHMMTVPPQIENDMLHSGLPAEVHPTDNDVEHMQVHQMAVRMYGDPHGTFKAHMLDHMKQLKTKAEMAAGAQQQQGPAGGPGQPKPGAVPGIPRGIQAPPGAIHTDQMQDPSVMERGSIQ